jgi:Na+/proline symporter
MMPANIGISDALHVGGKLGKLNVITSGQTKNGFDWNDRYNIWSGLIGGFFLALSYFGTDQSQVGRYLTAQSNRESRIGLLMNGLIKIPMQFFILLIGVLVFAFYQFNATPLSFNDSLLKEVKESGYKSSVQSLQLKFDSVNTLKQKAIAAYTYGLKHNRADDTTVINNLRSLDSQSNSYRSEFKQIATKASLKEVNDTNYIFLSFVKNYLPQGLKGLLIAIIFIAAWGSIAASLNSLAASTVVDFHQRITGPGLPLNEYRISKWYTLAWGIFSILIAQFSTKLGQSLIEAVNVLGSLFYGVILGIFLVAFYCHRVKGSATFIAAIIIELFVVLLFFNEEIPFLKWLPDISFLWLNLTGAIGVVILAWVIQLCQKQGDKNINV